MNLPDASESHSWLTRLGTVIVAPEVLFWRATTGVVGPQILFWRRTAPCGVHVSHRLVCVPPSYSPLADTEPPFCARGVARTSTVMRAASAALPQGPSLRAGLCCPGPSSLIRPHPSHSRAHPDFTAGRLIRAVFAVCAHLGDPRVVPGFRWQFCLDMSPSETPGRSSAAYTQSFADDTGLRPLRKVSAPPTPPHSASRGESNFGAY